MRINFFLREEKIANTNLDLFGLVENRVSLIGVMTF